MGKEKADVAEKKSLQTVQRSSENLDFCSQKKKNSHFNYILCCFVLISLTVLRKTLQTVCNPHWFKFTLPPRRENVLIQE